MESPSILGSGLGSVKVRALPMTSERLMRSSDLGIADIDEPITFSKCRWRQPHIFYGHAVLTSSELAFRDIRLHFSMAFAVGFTVKYLE